MSGTNYAPGAIYLVWKRIERHLPTDVGVERVDDRRVISGIVHVLKSGCRWCDCPPDYGPPTTIYNRFVRWRGAVSGKTCSGNLLGAGDPMTRR
jgi:transposase